MKALDKSWTRVAACTVVAAALLLGGCKADSLTIKISADNISAATQGDEPRVSFVAEFKSYGDLDDKKRAELELVEGIVDKYLDIDDIDITKNGGQTILAIEGTIPVSTNAQVDDPWFIKVSEWDDQFDRVELATGSKYKKMATEILAISWAFEPEQYHEVKMRLKAKDKRVIAPLAQVDTETHLFYDATVTRSVSLNFVGDAFTEAGAGFLISK